MRIESPANAFEAAELIADAAADGVRLEILGGGSKRRWGGGEGRGDIILSTERLSGIVDYDPGEMVLTVRAGTRLDEVGRLLAANGQMLGFEPPDFGALFGGPDGAATVGGVLAANHSGPRRILAGAARDHFLGFEAVNGQGVVFKAGGKVVKNVTGFDLSKLMAGSWGTLGLLTTVTLKVMPRPRTVRTAMVRGATYRQAAHAVTRVMGLPLSVSGAAMMATPAGSVTALRLEGFGPSVETRLDRLRSELAGLGEVAVEGEDFSANFWRDTGRIKPLAAGEGSLWRLTIPPASWADIVTEIDDNTGWITDWAGGLVWALIPTWSGLDPVRLARQAGGAASLVRGESEPAEAAKGLLSDRVRAAFDPNGVFLARPALAA